MLPFYKSKYMELKNSYRTSTRGGSDYGLPSTPPTLTRTRRMLDYDLPSTPPTLEISVARRAAGRAARRAIRIRARSVTRRAINGNPRVDINGSPRVDINGNPRVDINGNPYVYIPEEFSMDLDYHLSRLGDLDVDIFKRRDQIDLMTKENIKYKDSYNIFKRDIIGKFPALGGAKIKELEARWNDERA